MVCDMRVIEAVWFGGGERSSFDPQDASRLVERGKTPEYAAPWVVQAVFHAAALLAVVALAGSDEAYKPYEFGVNVSVARRSTAVGQRRWCSRCRRGRLRACAHQRIAGERLHVGDKLAALQGLRGVANRVRPLWGLLRDLRLAAASRRVPISDRGLSVDPRVCADWHAMRDWSVGDPAKRERGEGADFLARLGAEFR
jgi:hypothetical protein